MRGQNIPVEATELAERERRRQIAIAHQEAIRQQLEERERKRKEEREQRIMEEREEELRIEREQELERRRSEMELQRIKEKNERERKRKEALEEALEIAQKTASERKQKLRVLKQNINENISEKSKSPRKDDINGNNVLKIDDNLESKNENMCDNNNLSKTSEDDSELNNKRNQESRSRNICDSKDSIMTENNRINSNRSITPRQPPSYGDNLALLLQTPLETLQNIQFAVLMPALGNSFSQTLPLAVPIALANDTPTSERTENRVLTPSQYRNRKFCDSSTQTENTDYNRNYDERYVREKFSTLDLHYEVTSGRAKLRSEERGRDTMEERPKWGANRPPTRYLKQSEKDPVYQRRKFKQKIRQFNVYNDRYSNYSPHSSDDSQTASPVTHRRKGFTEKRDARRIWRKNQNHLFARNVSMYQTEIIPLDSDKDQIYYKSHTHKCCCRCLCGNVVNNDIGTTEVTKIQDSMPKLPLRQTTNSIDTENNIEGSINCS